MKERINIKLLHINMCNYVSFQNSKMNIKMLFIGVVNILYRALSSAILPSESNKCPVGVTNVTFARVD